MNRPIISFALLALIGATATPALAERVGDRDHERQRVQQQQPQQHAAPKASPWTTLQQRQRSQLQQRNAQQQHKRPVTRQSESQQRPGKVRVEQRNQRQPAAQQKRSEPRGNYRPQPQPRVEQRNQRQPAAKQYRYEPRRDYRPQPRPRLERHRRLTVAPPRHVAPSPRYRPVPAYRFYRGIRIDRHYGHRYHGYGYYYNDDDAFRWLAFTVLTLAIINQLDETQQRMHEQALIRATTAEIGDTIYWQDRHSYGSVTVTDIWIDYRRRECRQLEQSITTHGRTESSRRIVCQNRSGVWEVVSGR